MVSGNISRRYKNGIRNPVNQTVYLVEKASLGLIRSLISKIIITISIIDLIKYIEVPRLGLG